MGTFLNELYVEPTIKGRISHSVDMNYENGEFDSDNIVEVSVGTTGHKWRNGGHGTFTHIKINDAASTMWEAKVSPKKEFTNNSGEVEIFLEGDAELETAIQVARFIADSLEKLR